MSFWRNICLPSSQPHPRRSVNKTWRNVPIHLIGSFLAGADPWTNMTWRSLLHWQRKTCFLSLKGSHCPSLAYQDWHTHWDLPTFGNVCFWRMLLSKATSIVLKVYSLSVHAFLGIWSEFLAPCSIKLQEYNTGSKMCWSTSYFLRVTVWLLCGHAKNV